MKFSSRFYGPFKVVDRVEKVLQRLELPPNAKVHPLFSRGIAQSSLPSVGEEGQLMMEPEKILDRRMTKRGNRAVIQLLIQWSSSAPEDSTWEDA